ncbi:DUF3231 family protein [Pseudoneobacillus sp. C159]
MNTSARLSSAEIGNTWQFYIQGTLARCLLKYFLYHLKDEEITSLLQRELSYTEEGMKKIADLYAKEEIPIPDGFSDQDINFEAPPLFYDEYALSFVYSMSRMNMINRSFILANTARADVLEIFTSSIHQSVEIYNESIKLSLSKGIYDRPPMIPYPKEVEYIQKKWFILPVPEQKRPLTTIELTELFFNIERNYFAVVLCLGLQQVVKDKEIKKYIDKGREISERQIKVFNDILKKEDLFGLASVPMLVTESTVSPFSDKFIVALFHFLNAIDLALLGHALSLSMRADLSALISKFIGEILLYEKDGFNILVERGWAEQPPMAPNRKDLASHK